MRNDKKIWFTVREKRPEFLEDVFIITPTGKLKEVTYVGYDRVTFRRHILGGNVPYKKWCKKSDLEEKIRKDIIRHESLEDIT